MVGNSKFKNEFLLDFCRVDKKEEVVGIEKNLTNLYGTNFMSTLPSHGEEMNSLNEAIVLEKFKIHMYSVMIFVGAVGSLLKTYLLLSYCRRASINMHKAMLTSVLAAPMSFFDKHFIGNILNRFSQDMNNVDEILPFVFTEVFRVSLTAQTKKKVF